MNVMNVTERLFTDRHKEENWEYKRVEQQISPLYNELEKITNVLWRVTISEVYGKPILGRGSNKDDPVYFKNNL